MSLAPTRLGLTRIESVRRRPTLNVWPATFSVAVTFVASVSRKVRARGESRAGATSEMKNAT